MPTKDATLTSFDQSGHFWLRGALDDTALAPFDTLANDHAGKPGARLAAHSAFAPDAPLARAITARWPKARPCRAVIFDKTEAQNWGVPWHQDRIIALHNRHDLPGFRNWSQKQGLWHCEPPVAILNQMLFVRLHLDASDAQNGAMQIAPGSHQRGLVPEAQTASVAAHYPCQICTAQRGEVLVLPMLTLHRSRPAERASARRTLRIDYALTDLPMPLEWAW